MSVSARFFVQRVTSYAGGSRRPGWAEPSPNIEVVLNPVSGGRHDANKEWASATPSGEIKLTVGNPVAAEWFAARLGQDIAITFEDRPAGETE